MSFYIGFFQEAAVATLFGIIHDFLLFNKYVVQRLIIAIKSVFER